MSGRNGYDEKTLVRLPDLEEVYGADGYGWYAYSDTAHDIARRSRSITLRTSPNPLFVYLDGATRKSLGAIGFRTITTSAAPRLRAPR